MSGTIREPHLLGPLIGARLVEITEQGEDDEGHFVAFHFDNGITLTVPYDPEAAEVFTLDGHPAYPGTEEDDVPEEPD